MLATVVDMIDNKPRYRSDIAVPRPDRFIGMAISARALQQSGNIIRNLNVSGHNSVGLHNGIRPGGLHELSDDYQYYEHTHSKP